MPEGRAQITAEDKSAVEAHLSDEDAIRAIVDEGLQTVADYPSAGSARRAGRLLVAQHPHIGDVRQQPAEHKEQGNLIPTATGVLRLFVNLMDPLVEAGAADAPPASRFARVDPIILLYITIVLISIRLDGGSLMQDFEETLDLCVGYSRFEAEPMLTLARRLARSLSSQVFHGSTVNPDVLQPARTTAGAAATGLTVSTHKAFLPELPSDCKEHKLFQWLKTLLNNPDNDKTHSAIQTRSSRSLARASPPL